MAIDGTRVERRATPWYRIEQNGKDYIVVRHRKKAPPEIVPGTDRYQDRAAAWNALVVQLMRDYQSWD